MLVATVCALVAASVSPNIFCLAVASLAIGILTIVPQLILPFAAHLAKPQEGGRVVGTVMSGLFIGILLARTVSGYIGARGCKPKPQKIPSTRTMFNRARNF